MRLQPTGRVNRSAALTFAIAVVISGAASFATTASAATSNMGTLTFAPTTGSNTTSVSVTTDSQAPNTGCPTGTIDVTALVNGPGDWTNIPVLSDTASNLSTTSDFTQPLADSWQAIAERYRLTITPGRYDVSLTCQDGLASTVDATFDSPIFFTAATHYQSNDPHPAAPTTTTVTTNPGSMPVAGTSVTFTAAVSPQAQGTVQFKDGAANLGVSRPVTAGRATLTSTLPVGSHSISAVFTPRDVLAFTGSTSPAITTVVSGPTATPTSTGLTVNPGPNSVAGTALTFTAAVSPAAEGTVQFKDGAANLGVSQPVTAGRATLTSTLPVGSHSISAVFTPVDALAFTGSTSPATPHLVVAAGQPVTVPAPPVSADRPSRTAATRPTHTPRMPRARTTSAPKGSSTAPLNADFTGLSQQLLPAAALLPSPSAAEQLAAAVPDPLIAPAEKVTTARQPVTNNAGHYTVTHNRQVALLPAGLIVFGITVLFITGYAKALRFLSRESHMPD